MLEPQMLFNPSVKPEMLHTGSAFSEFSSYTVAGLSMFFC
jgi:hypothetical protein